MPTHLKIFVSYAHEDRDAAKHVVDLAEGFGNEVWFDEVALMPGHDWELEIRRGIREADGIIMLVSPRSVSKTGVVQRELRLALKEAELRPEGDIFIIPVRLDHAHLPDSLSGKQYVDFDDPALGVKLEGAISAITR